MMAHVSLGQGKDMLKTQLGQTHKSKVKAESQTRTKRGKVRRSAKDQKPRDLQNLKHS